MTTPKASPAAAAEPVVPVGQQQQSEYVLVPRRMTTEMREAFHIAQDQYYDNMNGMLVSPDHQWRAVLAAAPPPQAREGAEPVAWIVLDKHDQWARTQFNGPRFTYERSPDQVREADNFRPDNAPHRSVALYAAPRQEALQPQTDAFETCAKIVEQYGRDIADGDYASAGEDELLADIARAIRAEAPPQQPEKKR